MGFFERFSLGTHLLIAAGLLLAVIGVVVGRNWTTFALMYDNLAAMNEGTQVAEQMHQPEDLLDYLAAHPDRASLVAYEVDTREEGIFFEADRRRPLAHTAHLLLLAEYARQVDAGPLAPDERVPLDSLAIYALPGAGQRTHQQAVTHWRESGELRADSTVALRHVVDAVFRFGDAASADWLMMRLGRDRVQVLPERWDIESSDPPLPNSGVYLSWGNADRDSLRVEARRPPSRKSFTDRVYRHVRALRRDSSFRRQEREQLKERGPRLSVRDQRALAGRTYPKGTARDYADLLARIAKGELGGPGVATVVQEPLESPVDPDSVQAPIAAVATHVGAMPGTISFVGYALPPGDGPSRVSVLLLEDLPIGLFYHLVQTGLDKGFQLRLLSDPDFFQKVRSVLSEPRTAPEEAPTRNYPVK